jgi:hypothetical protein
VPSTVQPRETAAPIIPPEIRLLKALRLKRIHARRVYFAHRTLDQTA